MNMQHVIKIGTTICEITGLCQSGFRATHPVTNERLSVYPRRDHVKVVERCLISGRFVSVTIPELRSNK
jgi:hypothetical protein